ncbi:hypothetical protein CEXT_775041 [Caerostris extrusa]|uniref:Uncharacterized protein n=1 Tax=Caerostris extrusa TaxID=172846 RepID=A0AAV4N704_CAEEX|nr:hypothetical protein CEXT_775041 [Caerostris extrusa]
MPTEEMAPLFQLKCRVPPEDLDGFYPLPFPKVHPLLHYTAEIEEDRGEKKSLEKEDEEEIEGRPNKQN